MKYLKWVVVNASWDASLCDNKIVRSAERLDSKWAANMADMALAKSSNMGIGQAIDIIVMLLFKRGNN